MVSIATDLDEQLPWRDGNQITLLCNGADFFPAVCKAIDMARVSVHLETYIFNLDITGMCILDHLAQACLRGVRVRLVVDGFGSARQIPFLEIHCQRMGAHLRIYRREPVGLDRKHFSLARLRRLHRKTLTTDGQVAFVGGLNVLDDYVDIPDTGPGAKPRFDFAVRLEGPIVRDIVYAQRVLWIRLSWRRKEDTSALYLRIKRLLVWVQQKNLPVPPVFHPGRRAVLLLRDNVRFRQTIEQVYLNTIARAHMGIVVANAYFFPGRRLRQALIHAARRGVRVRLLLQGRPEYPMQYRACRYTYEALMDHGVELYEYTASYLHAKVAVIDDYAMVGSANMDPFSLLLAREANVYIHDAPFANNVLIALEHAMDQHAVRVTTEHLQRRSWWVRLADWFAYHVLRAGVALTGRSADY